MNNEMAYLLGMIVGNGEIRRGATETIVSVEIPHKKMETDTNKDVRVYTKASVLDITNIISPLLGTNISFVQSKRATIFSFKKNNQNHIVRELLRYVGNASSHENVRVHNEIFHLNIDEKRLFLRGFSDVTGYIRKSNYFFKRYLHRVYLEVPRNWFLVIDICNLLKNIDIPVQNIDWAHPNMRDPNLKKSSEGKPSFWKKEHQIKIWANEFERIGFGVLHKAESLHQYSKELTNGLKASGRVVNGYTHRYYWQTRIGGRKKLVHPSENDDFIPEIIRGKHFDSWQEIAGELGYSE
jgi:hypothetical protein